MSDAPSWLTEESVSTAQQVASDPKAQKAAKAVAKTASKTSAPSTSSGDLESGKASASSRSVSSNSAAASSEFIIEAEVLVDMQRWHLALRICYMVAAILMAVFAGLALQDNADIGKAFFAFYVLFFCTLICCFEFALQTIAKWIAINFGFMYTLAGRTIFLVLVGIMSFSISSLGIFAMCLLYAVGLFHIYIMFRFPRFEEYLRKKHYFEGRQASMAAKK